MKDNHTTDPAIVWCVVDAITKDTVVLKSESGIVITVPKKSLLADIAVGMRYQATLETEQQAQTEISKRSKDLLTALLDDTA